MDRNRFANCFVIWAEHALDHPGSSLKEYQIATEIFGRPHDFDPQHDSTIRVQAGRLRLKLAEYYSTEGAEDNLVVEMPEGHVRGVVSQPCSTAGQTAPRKFG